MLLRKVAYPYEDIDSWEKFNETPLPDKKDFYSEFDLEDITDKDYAHAQKIWEVFELKNHVEYHDLYVKCDTLLLADVFQNFRDKCIEIYGLDPAHFLSAPGSAWQAYLKKTGVKLELLTDIDMPLMVEERIRGGIRQYIGMLKQTISIWIIMIKASYHHVSRIWMQIICMDERWFKRFM